MFLFLACYCARLVPYRTGLHCRRNFHRGVRVSADTVTLKPGEYVTREEK
jgi:hypothetical protein